MTSDEWQRMSDEQKMTKDEQRKKNRKEKSDLEERLIDIDFREEHTDGTAEQQKTLVVRQS